MRRPFRFAAIVTALVLPAPAALANMRSGAVELGVFAGSYHLTEEDEFDTRSYVSGFRIGLLITPEHELEFAYDTVDVEAFGVELEELDSWNVRYLFNFETVPGGRVVPYVGAGIGSVDDDFGIGGSDDDTQVSAFGGLRIFAGRTFCLRNEVAVKSFSTFGVDQSVVEFTAGVSWVVGGRARRRPGQVY